MPGGSEGYIRKGYKKVHVKGSSLLLAHIPIWKRVIPCLGLIQGNRRFKVNLLLMLKKGREKLSLAKGEMIEDTEGTTSKAQGIKGSVLFC
jgi:hypothetical protein